MAASRPRIACFPLSSQTGFGGKGNGFPSISQAFVSALQMLIFATPEFPNSGERENGGLIFDMAVT